MPQFTSIELTSHEGWTELRLNRPEKRNAISSAMARELIEILSGPPQVFVLTAAGPIYCAGADLADRGEPGNSPSLALLRALLKTQSFVIAEVQNPALGAGAGLPIACSAAVCSEESWFALPEFKAGFFPAAMAALLDVSVSPRVIMELALGRSKLDAHQALSAGLISTVVPVSGLRQEVMSRVEQALQAPELCHTARQYWQQRVSRAFSAFVE